MGKFNSIRDKKSIRCFRYCSLLELYWVRKTGSSWAGLVADARSMTIVSNRTVVKNARLRNDLWVVNLRPSD
jgi:hypothetical protein